MWGIVGKTSLGQLSDETYGFQRTVDVDVDYESPPLPNSLVWRPVAGSSRKYEWALSGAHSGDQLLALEELGRRVGEAMKEAPAKRAHASQESHVKTFQGPTDDGAVPDRLPRDAQLFNRAVDALLELVAQLHEPGQCGLGLLTPAGIVFSLTSGLPQPLLLDLGFAWNTSEPTPPLWFKSGEWTTLWDAPAEVQQKRGRQADRGGDFDPKSDVRLLGRVFAACLLGHQVSVIPGGDATVQPCWRVLRAAVAGDLSLKELQTGLRESPLSTHFQERPKLAIGPGRVIGWRWPLVAAGAILAVVAAYTMAPDAVTNLVNPVVAPPKTAFAELPVAEQAAAIKNLDPRVKPADEAEYRQLFLADWKKSFQDEYPKSQDLTLAFASAPRLKDLFQHLKSVHSRPLPSHPEVTSEEDQWLNTCYTLSAQVAQVVPGFSLD